MQIQDIQTMYVCVWEQIQTMLYIVTPHTKFLIKLCASLSKCGQFIRCNFHSFFHFSRFYPARVLFLKYTHPLVTNVFNIMPVHQAFAWYWQNFCWIWRLSALRDVAPSNFDQRSSAFEPFYLPMQIGNVMTTFILFRRFDVDEMRQLKFHAGFW